MTAAVTSVVADGFAGAEGPTVLADGSVAVCGGDAVWAVAPTGGCTLVARVGGDPNGLAVDANGDLLVANNGGVCRPGKVPGSIQRIARRRGSDRVAVTTILGGLDAPNDIVVHPDGDVWFTDSVDCWFNTEWSPGRVHRVAAAGPSVVHEGLLFPNGIAVAPDGSVVVAESRTGMLWRVGVTGAHPWTRTTTGAPDGLCFTADGHCVVCCFDVGVVEILDAAGRSVERVELGTDVWPTNCAVAPQGGLYVTDARSGSLLHLDVRGWPA